MKTEEDEAFEDIERRQGDFQAKRAMAADKLQEPVLDLDGHVVREPRKRVPKPKAQPAQEPDDMTIAYMSGFYDGKKKRPWVGLTEPERNDLEDYCEMIIGKAAFDAIEAKLKERNHGT